MSLPSIWLVGESQERVFSEAVSWLRSHARCQCFNSPGATAHKQNFTNDHVDPQAIVLLQSRPGQFSAVQIEQMHAQAPLTRLIALTGPWCEGEQRSGRPLHGVVRISWRNWRERLPMALTIDNHAARSPRTITETEQIENVIKPTRHLPSHRGTVVICSERRTDYNHLAAAAKQLGFSAAPLSENSASTLLATVVIFDGWEEAAAFEKLRPDNNCNADIRRILVLHFPRPDDHIRAQQAGIEAVLAHPLSLADLNAALSRSSAPAA
jgi:hypothetical protein